MDILKIAIEWAKSEVFSTRFFMVFALIFLIASLGFWQLGKTEIAKAYVIPTLVAGILLMTIGVGLFYTNKMRVKQFEIAYHEDASAFIASEVARVDATLKEYTNVFRIIPMIMIVASLVIIFVQTPTWRAISITTIAMMIVILLVDGTAHARIDQYRKQLEQVTKP